MGVAFIGLGVVGRGFRVWEREFKIKKLKLIGSYLGMMFLFFRSLVLVL